MKIDLSALSASSATPLTLTPKAGFALTDGIDTVKRTKDAVQLSGSAQRLSSSALSSDFDAARVAVIRADIRAGHYQIHPEQIASGLLASVRDLLAQKTPV